MVDFNVHAPWPLMLLASCVVLGIPAWIGYLIGRVRTLDPRGQRTAPGETSPAVPVMFGLLLVLVGVWILLPVMSEGFAISPDAGGILFLLLGIGMFGLGAWYIARAVRLGAH